MSTITFRFDRGTICVEGDDETCGRLSGVLWDERTCCWRAPAYLAARMLDEIARGGARIQGQPPWPELAQGARPPWTEPSLRDYQAQALRAWQAFQSKGIVSLPTGAGKTRVALAAMASARGAAAVLCPTRALLEQWEIRLAESYGGRVGVVGDGRRAIEAVTVFTFESAYRHMDALGDRFRLLVVDEAHHFGGGARQEALETCAAPLRLGLTATPPQPGSAALARLEDLIGPVVCEVAIGDLVGGALADFDVVRVAATLSQQERRAYEEAYRPFAEMRRTLARSQPGADWAALVAALSRSAAGRAALRGFHRAAAIASMPASKMHLVSHLLSQHRADRTLVFCATAIRRAPWRGAN